METQVQSDDGTLAGGDVLSALDKPALIVDRDGFIVQVNSAAQDMASADGSNIVQGAHLSSLLPDISSYITDNTLEFDTKTGIESLCFSASVRARGMPVCNRQGDFAGWLVML